MLKEISFLRSLAILLVVLYHTISVYTPGWGCEQNFPVHTYLGSVLNSFHLPLFVFISGYLYCYLMGQGKYWDKRNFIFGKAKRLLQPYLIFGLVIILVMQDAEYGFEHLLYGISHLWFLVMLFNCFVVVHALRRYWEQRNVKRDAVILVCLFVLHVFTVYIGVKPRLLCIGFTFQFIVWFYLGIIVAKYWKGSELSDHVLEFLTTSSLVVLLVIVWLSFQDLSIPNKVFLYSSDVAAGLLIFSLFGVIKRQMDENGKISRGLVWGGKVHR